MDDLELAIGPVDVGTSFFMSRMGMRDPTAKLSENLLVKVFSTRVGVARVTIKRSRAGIRIRVEGDFEPPEIEAWLELLRRAERPALAAAHPLLTKLHRASPGLRVLPVPWLFEMGVVSILQQRIAFSDARRQYVRLAELHGERTALGVAFPGAARLSRMPTWELERVGVDKKRARAIIQLAREERFRSFLSPLTSHAELRRRLLHVRGIGPWTTDMTMGFGAGDIDALPLGDLHLPHLVAWVFDREPRGTDERMVELLEPYRGHRFQVVRLLLSSPSITRKMWSALIRARRSARSTAS